MSLKRYKFLTNRYIIKARAERHSKVKKKLQKESKTLKRFQLSAKSKYIAQLPLKLLEPEFLNADRESVFDFEKLKCNSEWPVCAFDHTFKARRAVYFQYRIKSKTNWIDDYFVKYRTLKLSSTLPKEEKAPDNTVMIEWNRHCCTNQNFVNKLIRLLTTTQNCESAFPLLLIENNSDDPLCYNIMLKTFIEFINFYTIPECEERKSEQLIKVVPQMKPKTMIGNELIKLITEDTDIEKAKRNSISIDNPLLLEEMVRRYKPLRQHLEKVVEKTQLFNRNIDMDASPTGCFFMNVFEN
eukprot:TRINITY_DN8515_c0_g2_i1.p1 TRINITY_DN8515_c0_g2~~TRINITY_DN8515_c0_g2_i1.p1  ORF type:complete len:298 (-),score=94.85 TRINITY_DN8515_c0_g2_i1:60-953(-)